MKEEEIAENLNDLVQHYLYEVREHDYNISNLILTEPRWREREREESENKMQHITMSFKTFCGLQFSSHLAATRNITTK